MPNISVRLESSVNRDIDDLSHIINACGVKYINIDEKDVVNLLISYIRKEKKEEEIESNLLTSNNNENIKKVKDFFKQFPTTNFIEMFQTENIIKNFNLNDENYRYLIVMADKYKKKNSDILRSLVKFIKDPETIKGMLTWHLVFQGITWELIEDIMKKTDTKKMRYSFINFEAPKVHIYDIDKENFQLVYEKMQAINSYDLLLKNAWDYNTDPKIIQEFTSIYMQIIGGRNKELPLEIDSASAAGSKILALSMPNMFAIKLVVITYVYSLYKIENEQNSIGTINFIDSFIMFYALKDQQGVQGNYKEVYASMLKWLKNFNEYFNKF